MHHKSTIFGFFSASIAELLTFLKVSFIVGSHAAFFSLGHCLSPLIGRHGGGWISWFCYVMRTCFKVIITGSLSTMILFYHIPTFLGTLYGAWICPASSNPSGAFTKKIALSLLCALCILLFCIHPIGSQAALYSIFWLIPLANCWLRHSNFFIHALSSTLVTHAVGSVFWLYATPMTPQAWLSLIPIVCIERILFASGATLLEKIWTMRTSIVQSASCRYHVLKSSLSS